MKSPESKGGLLRGIVGGAVMLALLGCTEGAQYSEDLNKSSKEGILSPKAFINTAPGGQTEGELAELSRYLGQKSYLNPGYSYGYPYPVEDRAAEAAPVSSREEQESDIYKLGKEGSQLLFLLNNYRGLQVISYADGAENPKIIGRVHSTGRFSDDMYYDQERDRIIVLERDWSAGTESKSRLVIYDVSTPDQPHIESTISVPGYYSDSRIVGDVLYVASQLKDKGVVVSYNLKAQGIPLIDEQELQLQVNYQENMNIVEVPTEEGFEYYLIAALSESGWGWWGRNSVIEVVDISSERGHIKPLISVSAKGFVNERSQTTIKDHTLIVTSNYRTEGEDGIGRIAVETFIFPEESSEIITADEAQYRKLSIERKLSGLSGEAYEEKRAELLRDPEIGLMGRFVEENGTLKKLFADSDVTVGDTTGLSAQLQDVRYSNDLLYAFWVPANMIDPFDLFDISNPKEGVKYLGRLQFDGWIERAIPMEVQGRQFVLGLGWVVPNVNNEDGRRAPQALLFEIIDSHGTPRALDVAKLSLEGTNIYTNFNSADKMVEVKFSGEGQGQILFGASRSGEDGWSSGGQVINFNVPALLEGRADETLTQGAFLKGNSGWVRRVFTNTLIDRVSSFSDRLLATFSNGDVSAMGDLEPAHVLELARNIRAYESLKVGDNLIGVQMISDYSWMTSDDSSATLLRTVPANKADTELPAVLAEQRLKGNYISHIVEAKSQNLILLTNEYKYLQEEEGRYTYKTTNYAYRVGVNAEGKVELLGEVQWVNERKDDILPIGMRISSEVSGFGSSYKGLVQLEDGRILAQVDSSLKWIELSAGIQAIEVKTQACQLDGRSNVQVMSLRGKTYLTSAEVFESRKFTGLQMIRNFLSDVSGEGNTLHCLGDRNIPGEPLTLSEDGQFLLTKDVWAEDVVKKQTTYIVEGEQKPRYYYQAITKNALTLVSLEEQGVAVLVDEKGDDNRWGARFLLTNGDVVQKREIKDSYGGQDLSLEVISIAPQGRILEDLMVLNTEFDSNAQLQAVVFHPELKKNFALLSSGRKVQVVSWDLGTSNSQVEELITLDTKLNTQAAQEVVEMPGSSYGFYDWKVHFTPELKSFEISQGLTGITQLFLAE